MLCGGAPTHDAAGKGRFFDPARVADCDHSMELMQEESIGPVVGGQKVSGSGGDAEAVALMNDSPYGLTASVFTRDPERAAWLMPLMQSSPARVGVATTTPPGHMQKE